MLVTWSHKRASLRKTLLCPRWSNYPNISSHSQQLQVLIKDPHVQGGAKKTGPVYLIANILKTPWPNCVEIGELLQYYMLNTVINFFLFKNFIALQRHLAKTQLLCDAQIYLYSVNTVFLLGGVSAMKFLNKKLMTVQHIILQKSTNFHAIRSWSFRNICNEIG